MFLGLFLFRYKIPLFQLCATTPGKQVKGQTCVRFGRQRSCPVFTASPGCTLSKSAPNLFQRKTFEKNQIKPPYEAWKMQVKRLRWYMLAAVTTMSRSGISGQNTALTRSSVKKCAKRVQPEVTLCSSVSASHETVNKVYQALFDWSTWKTFKLLSPF